MSVTPKYKFPQEEFFPIGAPLKDSKAKKRYRLEVGIKNCKGNERWLVILKNPSRAGDKDFSESDKTVNTVCRYFSKKMPHVTTVVIMNVFPIYQTYSDELRIRKNELIDSRNNDLLCDEIKRADGIILAWGGHPVGCKDEFERMTKFIRSKLPKRNVFQVHHREKVPNLDKPLHGQVWGYENYCLSELQAVLKLKPLAK